MNDATKWRIEEQDDVMTCKVFGPRHADGGDYAAILTTTDKEKARLIVRAVNAHEELVEALELARKRMLRYGERREDITDIDAALALARGQQ